MNQDKNTAGTTSDTFSKDRLKSEAEAGKGKLAELAESAASAGKAQLDSGLGQAAGQVEEVARVIDETASRLRSENHEGLAAYASQVAGSIENVANRLRNSSVDELATEARQLARSNPALFLLGSVAVGFGLTRFLKASSRVYDYDRMDSDRMGESQSRRDVYGSSYGDSRDPTHDWDSGTGGRSQGGWDAGSRGSSGVSGSNWDRGSSAGMGASSGAGSSGGMGGSASGGLGGSSGSSGMGGSTGSSGMGSSTGTSSGLCSSSGLGSSTSGSSTSGSSTSGGSTSGSGTSGSSTSGTRAGTDTFDDLRSKSVFPEMKTDGLSAGGTVGGTRTNQVSGGSNG